MKQIQLFLSPDLHRFAKVSAAMESLTLSAWFARLVAREVHRQDFVFYPNGHPDGHPDADPDDAPFPAILT